MKQTTLNEDQMKAVAKLGTGRCIFAYVDGKQTRMETERGLSPYVWKKGRWVKMVVPNSEVTGAPPTDNGEGNGN